MSQAIHAVENPAITVAPLTGSELYNILFKPIDEAGNAARVKKVIDKLGKLGPTSMEALKKEWFAVPGNFTEQLKMVAKEERPVAVPTSTARVRWSEITVLWKAVAFPKAIRNAEDTEWAKTETDLSKLCTLGYHAAVAYAREVGAGNIDSNGNVRNTANERTVKRDNKAAMEAFKEATAVVNQQISAGQLQVKDQASIFQAIQAQAAEFVVKKQAEVKEEQAEKIARRILKDNGDEMVRLIMSHLANILDAEPAPDLEENKEEVEEEVTA